MFRVDPTDPRTELLIESCLDQIPWADHYFDERFALPPPRDLSIRLAASASDTIRRL